MFLPIGAAPNPKGTPLVTYVLIAVNVTVFLLFNLPLGSQRADVNDPALREYVEVMARELSGRADVSQTVAQTSAYDLFSFEHGYRPAAPQISDLLSHLLAGEGGVAHGAHIGGFVVVGIAAWVMDRRGTSARPSDIETPQTAPLGADAVRAALADGRPEDAARNYFALPAPPGPGGAVRGPGRGPRDVAPRGAAPPVGVVGRP